MHFEVTNFSQTSLHAELASSFLKEATALKKRGELNLAIGKLNAAYDEIAKCSVDFTIAVFLRQPLYLQLAGRGDEAWQAFYALIENGYPNMSRLPCVRYMVNSQIYDKMRVAFHIEKKPISSICMGVRSLIEHLRSEISRPLEQHRDEVHIQEIMSAGYLSSRIASLLSAEKLSAHHSDILLVICRWVSALPTAQDAQFESELTQILSKPIISSASIS